MEQGGVIGLVRLLTSIDQEARRPPKRYKVIRRQNIHHEAFGFFASTGVHVAFINKDHQNHHDALRHTVKDTKLNPLDLIKGGPWDRRWLDQRLRKRILPGMESQE